LNHAAGAQKEGVKMNGSAAVMEELARGLASETITLIGLPSEKSARQQLSGTVDDLVKAVATLIEGMLTSAIEKRSANEFRAAVQDFFPVYFRSLAAVSGILHASAPRHAVESLVNESFCELEADFRDHAVSAFGADIRDQAIFTVWTLRKVNDLTGIIVSAGKVAELHKKRNEKLAANYAHYALFARFHIDCLTLSMRTKRTIYPDVLPAISDGLRAAVDAYAGIRQAVDLYAPQPEPELTTLEPDDEDRELLQESIYDMAREIG
jgi:hypothetical protein